MQQLLGVQDASPWVHIQSFEEYEDYDAYLPDSDGIGVILRLTLIPYEQRAYMSFRINDINGDDYGESRGTNVPWDIAVRMSGWPRTATCPPVVFGKRLLPV